MPAGHGHRGTVQHTTVNGVRIAYTDTGGTDLPLVLVHGSWGSHHNWDAVLPGLSTHFRVITYDRRGHSDSERPPGQGHFSEDVADLAGLVEQFGLGPAWVAGNSAGGIISLQLAAARPDLLRGIIVHEPPLFGMAPEDSPETTVAAAALAAVGRRIATGDPAGAAEQFVDDVALGPGSWERMPHDVRATMVANAPTFLDELRDPESSIVDEQRLARYAGPALLTSGEQSPPVFLSMVDRLVRVLPHAVRQTLPEAGHIPHVTHPDLYVDQVADFVRSNQTPR